VSYLDTFYEQLVTIKNTGKNLALKVLIWFVAILILIVLTLLMGSFGTIVLLLMAGDIYLAWFLSNKLNIEYEYILTNGEIDIDRITAKRKRKRMLNFKCADVERMGKYNPAEHANISYSKTYFVCNVDENSMFAVVRHKDQGLVLVIFSPNDKTSEGMKKYLPRQVSRDAFNGN